MDIAVTVDWKKHADDMVEAAVQSLHVNDVISSAVLSRMVAGELDRYIRQDQAARLPLYEANDPAFMAAFCEYLRTAK
jgi:hypothetical protein